MSSADLAHILTLCVKFVSLGLFHCVSSEEEAASETLTILSISVIQRTCDASI